MKCVSVKLCCLSTASVANSKRNDGTCGDANSYRMSVLKLQVKRVIGRYRYRRDRSTYLKRKDISVDRLRRGTAVNEVTRCPTLVSDVKGVRALCCRHRDGGWGGVTCHQYQSEHTVDLIRQYSLSD
jgi:hypothetical protein